MTTMSKRPLSSEEDTAGIDALYCIVIRPLPASSGRSERFLRQNWRSDALNAHFITIASHNHATWSVTRINARMRLSVILNIAPFQSIVTSGADLLGRFLPSHKNHSRTSEGGPSRCPETERPTGVSAGCLVIEWGRLVPSPHCCSEC